MSERVRDLSPTAGRPVVAADLSHLCGPTGGLVRLPARMLWRPGRVLDIDEPATLRSMYEIVLREAITQTELACWLDAATLHRVWAALYLPHGLRRDWELRHPSLRAARLGSPAQANRSFDSWLERHAVAA